MRQIFVLFIFLLLTGISNAQLNLNKLKETLTPGSLSSEEIGEGLKEALTKGVSTGTDIVSQLDGYYKNPEIRIPFPAEAKQVETKLRQIGMGGEVDKFIESLNRAAEDAATEAKPIFVSAIKQMTIQDALGILKGEDDAATEYLSRTTSPLLKVKFMPVIQSSLQKVNATRYYSDLVIRYNKIPFVQKVNPNLDEYATEKAIQGLFVMIAREEKNIRKNPGARTTVLLEKVFGGQP